MVKYYPFFSYEKNIMDGKSFENAIYYTTANILNDNKGYYNQNIENENEDVVRYFLISLEHDKQYTVEIVRYSMYEDWFQSEQPLRLTICSYENDPIQLASYQQPNEYGDGFYLDERKVFYFKITDNSIVFYINEAEPLYSFSNLGLNDVDKFYIKIQPNIDSFILKPNPQNFQNEQNVYNPTNDYNRENGIIVKKIVFLVQDKVKYG